MVYVHPPQENQEPVRRNPTTRPPSLSTPFTQSVIRQVNADKNVEQGAHLFIRVSLPSFSPSLSLCPCDQLPQ